MRRTERLSGETQPFVAVASIFMTAEPIVKQVLLLSYFDSWFEWLRPNSEKFS